MGLLTALSLASVAVMVPVVAFVFVVRRSVPPSIESGPTTEELGPERPAVVDLLTGGVVVEDDALPATVVDLAARGFIEIRRIDANGLDEAAAGGPVQLRLVDEPVGSLQAFERRIIEHLRACGASAGWVPATVFSGPGGVVSRRWWRGFVADVVDHSRELGLTRARYGGGRLALVWGALAIGAALVVTITVQWDGWSQWDGSSRRDGWSAGTDLDGSVGFIAMMSWMALISIAALAVGLSRSTARLPTQLGVDATSRWFGVRDHLSGQGGFARRSVDRPSRTLAHATALGLAPMVLRDLPLETDHDRHAWSTASGGWRRVRVRYASLRPHWGHSPWWAVLSGGLQMLAFGFLHVAAMLVADDHLDLVGALGPDDDLQGLRSIALLVAGIAAPAAVFGLLSLAVGLVDVVATRTVEGVVIARRSLSTGHRVPTGLRWLLWSGRDLGASGGRVRYHVAVDDGRCDTVTAHQTRASTFASVRTGARVRMRVTPMLGHVRSILEVAAPPGSEDALAHGLGGDHGGSGSPGVGPPLDGRDVGDESDAGMR